MNYQKEDSTVYRIKDKFIKFWRSDKGKFSLIRDVFIALILVLILVCALWAYTGQWFKTPMVAIESDSMMHPDEPFGRFGTIDAGDMVLLKDVKKRDDVVTRGSEIHGSLARKDKDNYFYGDYGDVIIYHPYGRSGDQIIHRAMCWVEVNIDDNGNKNYTVTEYRIINKPSITIEELGLKNYTPDHSGFITKGDNNRIADQATPDLCTEPIKVGWISGKARQELPWIGTINLFFNDLTSGRLLTDESTVKNVKSDSITCLVLVIVGLISIPISLDVYDYYRSKKKQPQEEPTKQETLVTKQETIVSEQDFNRSEEIEKKIDEKFE